MKPVYYSQYDPRWANIPYRIDNDPRKVISFSGCGPVVVAMILATWRDEEIQPPEMARLAIQFGDRTVNQGTSWTFFRNIAERYNLDMVQTSSLASAVSAVREGSLVACSMTAGFFTSGGHFVLAYGATEKELLVHDPANRNKTKASFDVFRKECIQYFIFTKKGKKEMPKKDWKDILKMSLDKPDAHIKSIEAIAEFASKNDIGILNIKEWLPLAIEKAYQKGLEDGKQS